MTLPIPISNIDLYMNYLNGNGNLEDLPEPISRADVYLFNLCINRYVVEMELRKQWNDFLTATVSSPWIVSNILSGVCNSSGGSDTKHPGVFNYVSSTSANSGVGIRTSTNSILLSGEERTIGIIKTSATLINTTRRIGFHSSADASTPTNGVYIKIDSGTLTGQTVSNNTISTTTTNYTVTGNTWYRVIIQLNVGATLATFTLYADDSNTVLWQDTLSTNIPKIAGREVGNGDICTSSGSSAITLGSIDYLEVILPNARRII